MKIFSIKNEKLGFFNRPIYCESAQEAMSYIQNVLCTDVDKALFGLKDDLALYYLGDIDYVTGVIVPAVLPVDVIDEANPAASYAPMFVCGLRDIFDSIPDEMVKPTVTRDEVKAIVEKVKSLENSLQSVNAFCTDHIHTKKGGKSFVKKIL